MAGAGRPFDALQVETEIGAAGHLHDPSAADARIEAVHAEGRLAVNHGGAGGEAKAQDQVN